MTAHDAPRPVPERTGFLFFHVPMLRIALPNKGRLAEETRELFADAGLPVKARGDRALTASLGGEFEAIFVRAADIPEFVADGAADAGVTGWDLVRESERPLDALLDLGFGRCRIVVAARDDSGISRIEDLDGAVEIAPHLGIADVIVDITSTGSTLRMNGMREIATVLESSARLIAAEGAT